MLMTPRTYRRQHGKREQYTPRRHSWVLTVVLLVIVMASPSASAKSSSSSIRQQHQQHQSNHGKSSSWIQQWTRAKCGDDRSGGVGQLWKYEGAVYDPLDGRKIASVHGVEWNTRLATTATSMSEHAMTPSGPNDSTIWSQRVFAYVTPSDDEKEQQKQQQHPDDGASRGEASTRRRTTPSSWSLLDRIRVKPHAPKKVIPLEQALHVYEVETTLQPQEEDDRLLCISNLHTQPSRHDQARASRKRSASLPNAIAVAKKPSATLLWSQAAIRNNDNNGSLERTMYTKRRSPQSPLYRPPPSPPTTTKRNKKDEVVLQPARSAWVQFGSSSTTMDTLDKFGARESYVLTTSNQAQTPPRQESWLPRLFRRQSPRFDDSNYSHQLKYTRYGEGPPFFAPGRMCMLELVGTPIASLDEASPPLRSILFQTEERDTIQIQGFQQGAGRLRLIDARSKDKWWVHRRRDQLQQIWERFSAASALQPTTANPTSS